MIDVDISNVWGAMSLPDLLNAEARINAAHRKLLDEQGNFRMPLPREETLQQLEAAAEKIRRESDVLVVLGMGPGCRCARGTVELLLGQNWNDGRGRGNPGILYAGSDFSSRRWSALLKSLEGKDFSVYVLPGEKEEPETMVALRSLKWNLERRYGTDGARERIYAAGGSGVLARISREEGWTCFEAPSSALLEAGMLLIPAVAGLNIRELLSGIHEMLDQCALLSYENPLWLYVGAREGLLGRGKHIEHLRCLEQDFWELGIWWQSMAARTDSRGPFPVNAVADGADVLPLDHQDSVFETLVQFAPPEKQIFIREDVRNIDGLNELAGRSLEQLQEARRRALVEAGEEAGLGIVSIRFEELTEKTLGGLLCFFGLACAMSALIRTQPEE